MKTMLLVLIVLTSAVTVCAQDCTVSVDSLKGQYTGGCKKGKAAGTGTATGTDTYTGSFKNGYPDGEGKYTWKNGNWYQGQWQHGLFEGKGTLHKTNEGIKDTLIIITGFWKKGKYTGAFDKPYTLTALTNNFSDLSIRKVGKTKAEISIVIKSITSGASDIANLHLPKPRLISVQSVEGKFQHQLNDETSSIINNKYSFQQVTFPFHAVFTFETESQYHNLHTEKIELEILESGDWYLQLNLDN